MVPAQPPRQPLIQLHRAGVRYGAVQALWPLDLTVSASESLALVGSNGSGKSSLLKLLGGALGRDDLQGEAGARIAHGKLRDEGSTRPLRVAMVFQHPFFLNLSVRHNLRLAMWLQKVPRAQHETRLSEALALVGLQGLAQRSALALSGGQQQRLALARAWCLRPDVLLLDEPTASLDPSAKREVEALIQTFRQLGVTVVFSTHNLGQAKRLATRVLYLEGGHVMADREVQHFFSDTDLPEPVQHFLKGELV